MSTKDEAKTTSNALLTTESQERTLKQIFRLVEEHIAAYMQSSESHAEKCIQIRQTSKRKSRSTKALTYPMQNTPKAPQESSTSTYCLSCGKQLASHTKQIIPSNQEGVAGSIDSDDVHTKPEPPSQHESVTGNVLDLGDKNMEHKPLAQETDAGLPEDKCNNSQPLYPDDSPSTVKYFRKRSMNKADSFTDDDIITEQNLSIMRENADLKIMMQEVLCNIRDIKKGIKHQCKETGDDPNTDVNQRLNVIDEIMSKVLSTQQRSSYLCDKLCEGLEKVSETKTNDQLPKELKQFCDEIKDKVGPEYQQIGQELGLGPEIINTITDEYSYDDACLHQVVLEWSRTQNSPSYNDLVYACHQVNPDILKSNPMSQEKRIVLQEQYDMLLDEMLEVAVIPHLVSSKIISFKIQKYILSPQTRDQRINRLLSVLFTRENGFDELLTALDKTNQQHVSRCLKDAVDGRADQYTYNSPESGLSVEDVKEHAVATSGKKYSRFRSCFSTNDIDSDDSRSCSSMLSSGSSPAILDSNAMILLQIYELLEQLGIPQKAIELKHAKH